MALLPDTTLFLPLISEGGTVKPLNEDTLIVVRLFDTVKVSAVRFFGLYPVPWPGLRSASPGFPVVVGTLAPGARSPFGVTEQFLVIK